MLAMAIGVVASLTSGLLIFIAYLCDMHYLFLAALFVMLITIPLAAEVDNMEEDL